MAAGLWAPSAGVEWAEEIPPHAVLRAQAERIDQLQDKLVALLDDAADT